MLVRTKETTVHAYKKDNETKAVLPAPKLKITTSHVHTERFVPRKGMSMVCVLCVALVKLPIALVSFRESSQEVRKVSGSLGSPPPLLTLCKIKILIIILIEAMATY